MPSDGGQPPSLRREGGEGQGTGRTGLARPPLEVLPGCAAPGRAVVGRERIESIGPHREAGEACVAGAA